MLYFMARALEYKWNTPFANYSYLGSSGPPARSTNSATGRSWSGSTTRWSASTASSSCPRTIIGTGSRCGRIPGLQAHQRPRAGALLRRPRQSGRPTNLTAVQAFRATCGPRPLRWQHRAEFQHAREKAAGRFTVAAIRQHPSERAECWLFLDKIKWLKISLRATTRWAGASWPGTSPTAAAVSSGTSMLARFIRPDRIACRMKRRSIARATGISMPPAPSGGSAKLEVAGDDGAH